MLTINHNEGLTSFNDRTLRAAAAAVIDLAGPAYILGMELPGLRGLYIAGLDRVFEREIRAANKWNGRGPAVAVDQGGIYGRAFAVARSEGLDERQSDRLARLDLVAVVLHEFAHAIANGGDGDGIMAEGPDLARAGFEAYIRNDPLPGRFKITPPVVPWQGHDVRFIRAAGILHSRLRHAFPLEFSDIVPPNTYGLSHPKFYAAAMKADGDFDFRHCTPIRAIIARAAGPVLTARWRADVFKWFQTTPMGPAQMKAAEEALKLSNGRRAKAEAVPVAAASDDFLPQPNEHFYELSATPQDWLHDSFQSEPVADGIRRMVAQLRTGKPGTVEQAAYYFDSNRFSLPDATEWMDAHGIRYAHCEPAKNATYPQLTS